MTWLALFAVSAASQSAIRVIEMPDPSKKNISVTVSVAAPYEMRDREQAAWRILPQLILQGTQEYSRQTIYDVSLQGGRLPQALGSADTIRIEFAVASGNLDVAAGMLENILLKPRFRTQDFEAAQRRLAQPNPNPIAELLDPVRPSYDRATVDLCRTLWVQACRPEKLTVVVGGSFTGGEAAAEFGKRFDRPEPAPARGTTRIDPEPKEIRVHAKNLTSFELASSAIDLSDRTAGAKMLAVYAMGAGKEASVYRVLREKEGLSYEQRAILWPTAKGWVPRIYVVRRAQDGDAETLTKILASLEADVDAWAEEDLERAKAIAAASLDGMPVDNLFWIDGSGPVGTDFEDECALRAYLAMIGAPEWTRDRLKLEMSQVSLERLKEAAGGILKTAKTRVIPGYL